MARTVGDCITEAREILQDTEEPHRYPDADLIRIFNSAVSECRRLRPDLFIGRLFTPVVVVDPSEEFPVDEIYWVAFVNYLTGRAELRDDQFNADGRAGSLLASFKAQMSTATA